MTRRLRRVYFTWDDSGAQKHEVLASGRYDVPPQFDVVSGTLFQYSDEGSRPGSIWYKDHLQIR